MNRFHDLTAAEARVIEGQGTEKPGSEGPASPGMFLCKRCDAPLYLSDDKFSSGCGWPSFDQEIAGSVDRIPDGDRMEIVCNRCRGHLGHIFEGEGFTEKGVRHCVNLIAMRFVPAGDRAIFAAGCFWSVQEKFDPEVDSSVVGYTGGWVVDATYEEVCTGETGHIEAVEVHSRRPFKELVELFFSIHDPFAKQKRQYQSTIFYLTREQKMVAQSFIRPGMATEILPASIFYVAENYH